MNVGIVGCGSISGFHIAAVQNIEGVEVTAICDRNTSSLYSMKDKFKIDNTYTSIDEMLKSEELDVIHVLTPPKTHEDLCVKAMKAGCHVLVEKPIALTLEEVDRMLDVAVKQNVKISVDHNLAYDPIVIKAHDIVNSYAFGKLVHIDVYFGFEKKRIINNTGLNEDGSIAHWSSQLKGGLIQDLAPHPFSMLFRFIDDYDEVTVIHKKIEPDINIPENELRLLINSNEVTANVLMSLYTHPDNIIINLMGTKMSLKVDVSTKIIIKQKIPSFLPRQIGRTVSNFSQSMRLGFSTFSNIFKFVLGKMSEADGINYIVNEFYRSLKSENILPPVTGKEARNVTKLMNDVWN